MSVQGSFRKGLVPGEFLTSTYRVSGEVEQRSDPLLDMLNHQMELFLQLEKAFVSPLLDPAVLTGNFPIAQVRKSSVGLVVLHQWKEGLPRREGQYVGRDHVDRPVLIVAAGFEVQGIIRLHPSLNVSNFIRTTPENFIPIFEASATLTAKRDIVFRGGAILLNRNLIEVFSVGDKAGRPERID